MLSRRQLLQSALPCALGVAALTSQNALAAPLALSTDLSFDLTRDTRSINLLRPVNNEAISLNYMHEGEWVPNAYAQICWLLRDVRAQQWAQMDIKLIAILDWTQRYLARYGYTQPLVILSGFRTLKTNNSLENASRNSMHLYGKAVDFAVPGLSSKYLAELMGWLAQGGVGAYATRGFVHIDTGRPRRWQK